MKKSIYIFILFLFAYNYFGNRYTSLILNKDILLVCQWVWCIIGLFVYRKYSVNPINTFNNRMIVYLFLLIMFLSTLNPYIEFDQPIQNTLISQRPNYSIIILLLLLYIHPTEEDIFTSIKYLTLLSFLLFSYSAYNPNFFFDYDIVFERNEYDNKDIGLSGYLPGFELVRIYFFYISYCLIKNKIKFRNGIISLISLMLLIILVQNRQSIIITLPIFIYTFYKLRQAHKKTGFILIFSIVVFYLGFYIFDIYNALIEESKTQLADKDYNRWQAIYVFLFEWKYNIYNFLFGNGVGSFNSSYTNKLARFNSERGAYLQDLGFIGSFFFYGIFFIILNFYLILRGFSNRYMPYYVKFWSFGILLIPVYQNWGMMNNSGAVTFSLMFYLIFYNYKYGKHLQKSTSKP